MQAGVAARGPRHRPVARHGRGRGAQRHRRSGSTSRAGSPTPRRIPYDDATFDLVVGHAVLHHIPDVELALREVLRVLKPGGRFVFAGEPTTVGDWYARRLGRLTWWATTQVTHAGAAALTAGRGRSRGAGRVVAGRRAGVGGRPAHVRPARRWRATALRAGAVDVRTDDRGADGGVPRLAGPHLRGGGQPGAARLGLGDVRLPVVAAAVRGRPACSAGSCRSGCSTTSCSPGRAHDDSTAVRDCALP